MISRRTFLSMAGITLVGAQFRPAFDLLHQLAQSPILGRTFEPTFLFPPNFKATSNLTTLWPDTVIPLLDADETLYYVPGGSVPRHQVQPMMPVEVTLPHPSPAYWAEVIAPIAPVYRFCATDAPLMTRIGHGGTAHIIDRLDNWLGLADEHGELWGWSPLERWQPAINPLRPAKGARLEISLSQQRLIAYEHDETVLETLIAVPESLTPRSLHIKALQVASSNDKHHGIPWTIHFEHGGTLCGVYWHNSFGGYTTNQSIQLPLLAARWLYAWIAEDTIIEVVS